MKKYILYLLIILAVIGGGYYLFFSGDDSYNEPINKAKELEDILNATSTIGVKEKPIIKIEPINNNEGEVYYYGQDIAEAGNDPILNKTDKGTVQKYKDELIRLKGVLIDSPYDVDSWLRVYTLKKIFNNYEGARDVLEFVYSLAPNDGVVNFDLGTLYGFYFKDYKKAEGYLNKALEIEPNNVSYYIEIADFYRNFYTEKKYRVEELINMGLKNAPKDVSLLAYAGGYYREIGNIEKALEYFKKVLEVDPSNQAVKEEVERLKSL